MVEVLLDTKISDSLANIIYYYVLFAIVLLLFHSFLAHTTSRFLGGVSRAMTTFCMGLLVFYGANELFYRVANVLFNSRTNLNDMTIAASINAAPRLTALIIVFLAPFVEEVLFRGLVFGCLKEKSRVAAYVISCVLFAFMHVWTFALSSWDWSYLILMLQYLVPGPRLRVGVRPLRHALDVHPAPRDRQRAGSLGHRRIRRIPCRTSNSYPPISPISLPPARSSSVPRALSRSFWKTPSTRARGTSPSSCKTAG